MKAHFCEAVEKAVIYTPELSGAVVQWQVEWETGRMPALAQSWSQKRIRDVPTTLQELGKKLSIPKSPPPAPKNFQPPRTVSPDTCATSPSPGQEFPASWSSTPMAGLTPAAGKASNI